MKYDVIIIGSGLGGLECGTILSRKGKKVLILERQLHPGGCMQSFPRGGLMYDTGLHYIGGLGEGESLYSVFKYLHLLDLPWHHLDKDAFDKVTIGTETFNFAEGYRNFADTLAERFPKEKKALTEYVDLLRTVDDEQLKAFTAPQNLADRLFTINAYDWLHEKFNDELLINVLSGTSLKMELHKETLPLFTFTHGNGSFIQSSWRLKGDGNLIVNKLISEIENAGGEIICGTDVEELVEKDGNIICARCSNGEVYEADIFISNAHPAVTCGMVKESTMMKSIYKKRISRLSNTFGMFTASLKIKSGAIKYFNHNKFVYDKPNVWELSEPNHDGDGILISCRVPEEGDDVRQIDLIMPMLWDECQKWEDTRVGHRGSDYLAMKEQYTERCMRLASKVMPDLPDSIEANYTSTPLTYRDYNMVPEGAAYGIRKDCNAPLMTILTPRTPIPNLLMTGQSLMLHGLHGVTMTSLFTCAEILGLEAIDEIVKG